MQPQQASYHFQQAHATLNLWDLLLPPNNQPVSAGDLLGVWVKKPPASGVKSGVQSGVRVRGRASSNVSVYLRSGFATGQSDAGNPSADFLATGADNGDRITREDRDLAAQMVPSNYLFFKPIHLSTLKPM